MIRMPKAERIMYTAQGLSALTEVLITDFIIENSPQPSSSISKDQILGFLRAMQILSLELESSITDAWENADNPTYIDEKDHKQARAEYCGLTDYITEPTWIRRPKAKPIIKETAK